MLIHWKFDPILLSLGPLTLRWYGLLFVGAFAIGERIVARIFEKEGVASEHAQRIYLMSLFGTVIGARLAHCLFYDPHFYLSHPLAILRIWEGGLASHGGAVGMLLGLWWGCRIGKLPFLWLVDRVAIVSALGAVFVRVANFINSEILGAPTSGTWGVVFDSVDTLPRHPVQLYEAVAYLGVLGVLTLLYRRYGKETPRGLLLGWFMMLVFVTRIVCEFFKTPQAVYEAGQVFSVGQYLSLPFVAFGVGMIVWSLRHGRVRP